MITLNPESASGSILPEGTFLFMQTVNILLSGGSYTHSGSMREHGVSGSVRTRARTHTYVHRLPAWYAQ